MKRTLSRLLAAISLSAIASGAMAQEADESVLDGVASKPSTPTSEAAGSRELRDAMRRIALSPTNADALADAGSASLQLGDANAALNFYTRASVLRPRDGRITAGLGAAMVRTENPFEALRLFDEAVKLGISERSIAADRGLAFDLLGNFGRAQQDYELARTVSSNDDLIIREAISMSLSGQSMDADVMLDPLLKRQNPDAWRARAFMLAARGDYRESSKVVEGFLDPSSAQKLDRYLRLMPNLTGAQQAAAINLGHFPASHQIGRDSEEVVRIAAATPHVATKGESRLIPAGDPLGPRKSDANSKPETKKEKRDRENLAKADAKAKTDAAAKLAQNARKKNPAANAKVDQSGLKTNAARVAVSGVQVQPGRTPIELPPPDNARPLVTVALPDKPAPAMQRPDDPVLAQQGSQISNTALGELSNPAETNVAISPPISSGERQGPFLAGKTATQPSPQPGFEALGSDAGETKQAALVTPQARPGTGLTPSFSSTAGQEPAPAIVVPKPQAAPTEAAAAFDLGAYVKALEVPEAEQKPSVVAVDLKKIKPVTPKAVTEAKADNKLGADKAPANPARHWVQLATGNSSAFSYDFKQMAKKNPDLFSGQEGWSSAWGSSDRLLIGPFGTVGEARKWEVDFRKSGGDGFVWQSGDGTVVEKVSGATAPKIAAAPAKEPSKSSGKQATKKSPARLERPRTALVRVRLQRMTPPAKAEPRR